MRSTATRCNSACPSCSCWTRSEEHTSELQSRLHLVCRLLLEKKKKPTRHARASRSTDSRLRPPASARTCPGHPDVTCLSCACHRYHAEQCSAPCHVCTVHTLA